MNNQIIIIKRHSDTISHATFESRFPKFLLFFFIFISLNMEYICSICTNALDVITETPAFLPCGHTFHKSCARTWIEMARKCPFCQKSTEKSDVRSLFLSGEPATNCGFDLKNIILHTKLKLQEAEEDIKQYKEENRYLGAIVDVYKIVATRLTKEEKLQGRHSEVRKKLELELETSQKKNVKQAELIKILHHQVGTAQKKERELLTFVNELTSYKSFVLSTFVVQHIIIATCIGMQLLPLLVDNFRKQFIKQIFNIVR
ncbi:uncharacterized protein EV154DRAFT_506251 [Mucor mucedo]|uniref:uncharacterized protein n=1 Tax=Mucor mucedo TaxID=29922 RepID=UPI0022202A2C|nr:uncharacterized protein EV154DRAFT_506251 [Mucor mucedo]KAI7892086.1 hypothetical protein EV154DRAFT_506251 [Mucor mucedo]